MPLCYGALALVVFLPFIAFPEKFVSWYARYCRNSYPDKRSLEHADRLMAFSPWNKYLFGTMSEFVAKGPDQPQAFPRLVWLIRIVVLIPLLFFEVFAIYFTFVRR